MSEHWNRQANTWTNDVSIQWRIYMSSSSPNELTLDISVLFLSQKSCNVPNSSSTEVKYTSPSQEACTMFCFVVVLHQFLSKFCRVTSQALRQSYDCPSASEVILKNMGKRNLQSRDRINTTKQNIQQTVCIQLSAVKIWSNITWSFIQHFSYWGVNQNLYSQKTPISRSSRWVIACLSIVSILYKTGHVMTALHCIFWDKL